MDSFDVIMKIWVYNVSPLYCSIEGQLLSGRCFPWHPQTIHCFPAFRKFSLLVLLVLDEVCACSVQALAYMCACVHVWASWFFSLYACKADVKVCAFFLPSLLCSDPARSEQGENKRGTRGGESAPTVDLAIVGGGTLFPLMLWTHGWNPQKL